jgi:hypothetical protein
MQNQVQFGTLGGFQSLANFFNNLLSLLGLGFLSGSTTSGAATTIPKSSLPQVNIGGVSNTIEGHLQSVVDNAMQALTGGTATGFTPAALNTAGSGLLAIPAGNIVGNLSGGVVTYGATGAGNTQSSVTYGASPLSWSHTIGASDNYVVVAVAYGVTNTNTPSCAATYGGTSMSSLGRVYCGGSSYVFLHLFGLSSPKSGAQTVTVTPNSGFGIYGIAANSVSMSNWAQTSAEVTVGQTASTSLSQTISSATNHLVVQAFCYFDSSANTASIASYNQTSRYNSGAVTPGYAFALVLGTAAGASSVSFTATGSGGTANYCAAGVDLVP